MKRTGGISRRDFVASATGGVLGVLSGESESQQLPVSSHVRDVFPGIPTRRTIPGEPYDLAGKRIVFTNWRYIRPGDLDWLDARGKSVYVSGSAGPFDAQYKGIDTPRGIRLTARKADHIVQANRPGRIRQDNGVLRGWSGKSYQESKDGMHWVNRAEMINPPDFSREVNVFIDPAGPASERYKCAWVDLIGKAEFEEYRKKRPDDFEPRALVHWEDQGKVTCIRGAVSPDGIRWTTLPDPLVVEYSDTEIVGYYDEVLCKYVLYTRQWSLGPYTAKYPANIRNSWTSIGRRCIGRSETNDFRRFPVSQIIVEPRLDMPPSDELYTNCRTTVPGAPDQHLMFPVVWHVDQDDTSIYLLSSADGVSWQFVPGGPVLDTESFGEWNGGSVWTSPNLVELPDGSFALPYRGDNTPHKYPRGQRVALEGYAIWPKGRLVALEAPDRGEFAMAAIMPPGRKLLVNAVTKRVGSIRVQVDGVPGRSFEDAVPIVGDQFRTPAKWKETDDLGFKEGSAILLRFRMEKAELYGIEFV